MKIFKILSSSLLLFLLMLSTGCQNTVSGFGKDMQNTGQEIQKSVNQ